MNLSFLSYGVRVPISPSITSLYFVKNTNYDAAVCKTCFVLSSLFLIYQNCFPEYFSHTLSIRILTIGLQSAIYSNRWSVTKDTDTLGMSTYLRHQSFNFYVSESATNAHSWTETEWHSKKRVWLFVLRVSLYPPLWNEFVRLWIILLQVAQHQIGHHNGCL